jgi:hypothetical protein
MKANGVRVLPVHGVNLTDEWHTPPELVFPLGKFDLDPAASHLQRAHFAGLEYCFPEQDGRLLPWHGRVWCNPPYSDLMVWARRFVMHDNGIFLVPARTETAWVSASLEALFWNFLFLRADQLHSRVDGRAR